MPYKKRNGSLFMYKTSSRRLDRLFTRARTRRKSPTAMLDQMIDDWLAGNIEPPPEPEPETEANEDEEMYKRAEMLPWYLR